MATEMFEGDWEGFPMDGQVFEPMYVWDRQSERIIDSLTLQEGDLDFLWRRWRSLNVVEVCLSTFVIHNRVHNEERDIKISIQPWHTWVNV